MSADHLTSACDAPTGRDPAPWYTNAVIYALDVKTFCDADGDGIGDFAGLTQKLDYLADLGATCLWLLPFYPSTGQDDGYDVADYCAVDPRLGTLADFRTLVQDAGARGIRVLIDLVVNHTSTEHPWFKAARSRPDSRYRDYYVWIERPPERERRGGVVFPGEESTNWTYDAVADAYYWHWFYHHQPDLNTGNPAVQEEIKNIIRFWLESGVAGFRVDAAPFLFKRKGLSGAHPEDPHAFLTELRRFLSEQSPDAIFLAETDVCTEELSFFFGEGERMHLLFNFMLNNYFFLALAREEAEPLRHILQVLPDRPPACHWANFVRNHDELNLDRLEPAQRELVIRRFAQQPDARIYDRGIRRRLAPMLDGDRRHAELTYSLFFSIPGAPVLRFGQEIGMGDDLALPGRMAVRTPMQWSSEPNGGFSTAPPDALVRPVIADDRFGYRSINVADQQGDRSSLLDFIRRLIAVRKRCPELGTGSLEILDSGDPAVLAHACHARSGSVIAVHNLSAEPRAARVVLPDAAQSGLVEVFADQAYPPPAGQALAFTAGGYGFRWFRTG